MGTLHELLILASILCFTSASYHSEPSMVKYLHKNYHLRHTNNTKPLYIDNATLYHDIEKRSPDIDEARLTGATVINGNKYPWLVALYDTVNSVVIGPGVVVADAWFVCHSDVIGTLTKDDFEMYGGLANPSTPSGRKYRIKQIVPSVPARDNMKNAISMVHFCPHFVLTKFTVPTTTPAAALVFATAVSYVNYAPAIQEVNRKMGITCQCEHYATFDATQHFCLDEEDVNFLNLDAASATKDLPGTICIHNNAFIGINVGAQNKGGEPYIEISKFQAWIKTTAGYT